MSDFRRSTLHLLLPLTLLMAVIGASSTADAQLAVRIAVLAGANASVSSFEGNMSSVVSWLNNPLYQMLNDASIDNALSLDVNDDIDENHIPDAIHAALLDYVLTNASAPGHTAITQTYQANLATAGPHAAAVQNSRLSDILPSGLNVAEFLAGLMTTAEPNAVGTLQAALLQMYPGFTPDPKLIPNFSLSGYDLSKQSLLSANGDLDGDGVSNLDEYLATGDKAGFLAAATNSGATSAGTGALLQVTSAPVYGSLATTNVSGTVRGLPDGTGLLVAYLSRDDGTYASKPTASVTQSVSNGTPWQYSFASDEDPYSVRMVFMVVPNGTSVPACPYGCDGVPEIAGTITQTALVRAPTTPTVSAPGSQLSYTFLDVARVGRGMVYATTGNLGYNETGSAVTLWARPALGWQFNRWWGDVDGLDELSDEISFTLNSGMYLVAEFISDADAAAKENKELITTYYRDLSSDQADISGGFTLTDDGGVTQDEFTVDATEGGELSFLFVLDEPGIFVVKAQVSAPSMAANSIFVNIDGPPVSPTMIWDIDVTSGYEEQAVSWRGTGSSFANEYVPKEFHLGTGIHTLTFTGREPGVLIAGARIERIYKDYNKWVDFRVSSSGDGSRQNPLNTITEAAQTTPKNGMVALLGGDSPEVLRITKAMRLEVTDSAVRIGDPNVPMPGSASQMLASATDSSDPMLKGILDAILANMAQSGGGGATGDLQTTSSNGAIRSGTVYEPVFPFSTSDEGQQLAHTDSVLAIRLRDERGIDPATIDSPVPGYSEEDYSLEWQPGQDDATDDIWALFRPLDYWYFDEGFSITVNAKTLTGETISPPLHSFLTENEEEYQKRADDEVSELWQPVYNEDYAAEGLIPEEEKARERVIKAVPEGRIDTPLPHGLGEPWLIGPEQVFELPQRVWLPVPEGINPDGVAVFYYFDSGGEDEGWYPAENVEGWMKPASYLVLDLPEGKYMGFLARHAGIAQLGVAAVDKRGMPITSGTTAVPPAKPQPRPYGYLLIAMWLVAAIVATAWHLRDYQIRKAVKKNWMRLGLVFQNENGPFYGKACWSGYYQDNQGVWHLDRRKNPDRRRLRVPTPRELDMRKTVRRKIDRQIMEWGSA